MISTKTYPYNETCCAQAITVNLLNHFVDLKKTCEETTPDKVFPESPIFFNAKLTSHTTLDALHVIVFDKVCVLS